MSDLEVAIEQVRAAGGVIRWMADPTHPAGPTHPAEADGRDPATRRGPTPPRSACLRGSRSALLGDLRQALADGEVRSWFQPQADSVTGQLVGAEALARWHHPIRGWIDPHDFVPLAEHGNLIRPLTGLMLDQSLAACAGWRAMGMPLRVSVNLSARNLLQPDLGHDVIRRLQRYELDPADLCLEITESLMLVDQPVSGRVLGQLADAGVWIALDDFGTGYSSMAHLRQLPVHELKIDKSFVLELGHGTANGALVQAMIELGRSLGLVTVAEGVESRSAWAEVRDMGCERVQGYALARPDSAERFALWLADQRTVGCKTVPRPKPLGS